MNFIPMAALAIIALILLWVMAHCAMAWVFRTLSQKRLTNSLIMVRDQPIAAPRVAVLMSLRGCDPCLSDTLCQLLQQEYADYEIVCVIDSRLDPAWRVVEEFSAINNAAARLRFFELQQPLKTCSLKCSSLVQAFEQMLPDREVVVLIDADVVPHRQWLSELVLPLADPSIGVVTGNQWFEPSDSSSGSILRSIWNSGAIVATAFNANPWAGTCALRVTDLRASGLIHKWQTSVVDDGPIKHALAQLGLKVYFNPRLIMVNRDQCSTSYVGRYVTRMLTWSRIYEKTFINTVLHSLGLLGLHVGWIAVCGIAAWNRQWLMVVLLAISAGLAICGMLVGYLVVRSAVRQSVVQRGGRLNNLTFNQVLRIFLLIPVGQLAHILWTVRAIFVKQATWRNITYRLYPGQVVEMESYRPFEAAPAAKFERASI